ncbi:MAG TPA: GNAT family N-acetyltransferase [Lentimicrobium sp.]|nr:GNAT family N-acetyltransferase [Lentimicrobium sp.]
MIAEKQLPEGFSIRNYEAADYAAVEKFWNDNGLGGAHRGDNAAVVEQTLKAGGHLLLLVSNEGKLAGTSWMTNDKRRTYLHHFGIAEPFRRLGLATCLLNASLEIAWTDGFQIKIEVHRDNLPAQLLYKKAGFTFLGDYDVLIIRNIHE